MILFYWPVEGGKREKIEGESFLIVWGWTTILFHIGNRTSQPWGQTCSVRAIVMDKTAWDLVILFDTVATLNILLCG